MPQYLSPEATGAILSYLRAIRSVGPAGAGMGYGRENIVWIDGLPELRTMLAHLIDNAPRRVVQSACGKSAKRIKKYIVQNLSGSPVGVDTGVTRAAFEGVKVKAMQRSRVQFGYSIPLPLRSALGIMPEDEYYYPAAIEYGARPPGQGTKSGNYRAPRKWETIEYGDRRTPAKRFIRGAVDDNAEFELRTMMQDISAGLEKEARKKGKR